MGIPPERDWFRYCIDQACHVLAAGHSHRDSRWKSWFARESGDGDLYSKHLSDPRAGRPPSLTDMALLDAAQAAR